MYKEFREVKMKNYLTILNKTFEGKKIRTVWNAEEEKYYISVVDIVGKLMECDFQHARNNWKVIKFRLKKEGNESVTNCNQLKLRAADSCICPQK